MKTSTRIEAVDGATRTSTYDSESRIADWGHSDSVSAFAVNYGEPNLFEGFATAVELYFSGNADQVRNNNSQDKLDLIDNVFSVI